MFNPHTINQGTNNNNSNNDDNNNKTFSKGI